MIEDIWKDIEGFEGKYQVSDKGRVKSLPRFKRKTERILKGSPTQQGYLLVQLRDKAYSGGRKSMLVHRLVMLAFQPCEVQDELFVNHKDLDVTNNRLDNLEWVTHQENADHFWREHVDPTRHLTQVGAAHHLSVLTDELVIEFRRRWELVKGIYGERSKLAREFGIAESTARLVTNGKTWKHLLPEV